MTACEAAAPEIKKSAVEAGAAPVGGPSVTAQLCVDRTCPEMAVPPQTMLGGQLSAVPHSTFCVQTLEQALATVVADAGAQPTTPKKLNSPEPH
jgi:hypothetical protein